MSENERGLRHVQIIESTGHLREGMSLQKLGHVCEGWGEWVEEGGDHVHPETVLDCAGKPERRRLLKEVFLSCLFFASSFRRRYLSSFHFRFYQVKSYRIQLAPTLQRQYPQNSKKNIPRNETARPQSQFHHSCFCERFYIFPRSVSLLCCRKIGGPIVKIYKSITNA
jgi:hypothetical protein